MIRPRRIHPRAANTNAQRTTLQRAGFTHCIGLLLLLIAPIHARGADVEQEVTAVLSRCLACHDAVHRKGGLRLDDRVEVIKGGDSGPAAEPGKSSSSELIRRLRSNEVDERMPPKGDRVAPTEIAALVDWIDRGMPWPKSLAAGAKVASGHWSFQSPRDVSPPADASASFQHPIDRFIVARLQQEGLTLAPEADRLTLARRLSLDLTGLPPTPEEADAFARDQRPDAYERLVDRLLSQPAYGERWARRWLDLARYADTNGYEKDRPRTIWPYRDWVIQALNQDMPYDQFTLRQLAGDLLPNATIDDQVATGFHRNTMVNEEGGIDVAEFRFYALVDRVNTTATTWLGLTLGCAQCHTHKYDPITQREYFQFMAFLDNTDDVERAIADPAVDGVRRRQRERLDKLRADRSRKGAELVKGGHFDRWINDQRSKSIRWSTLVPLSATSKNGASIDILPDGSVLATGDCPNQDVYVVEGKPSVARVGAIRLEALPHDELPAGGPGRAPFGPVGIGDRGDFFLGEITIERILDHDRRKVVTCPRAEASYEPKGRLAKLVIDGDLDTGWSITGRTNRESHLVLHLAEPIAIESNERWVVTLHHRYIHQMTLGRFRLALTHPFEGVGVSRLSSAANDILSQPTIDDRARERLLEDYLASAPELAEISAAIQRAEREMTPPTSTLVVRERPTSHRRVTLLRQRGDFLRPGESVTAAPPAFLPPIKDAGANRLALAHWLVDPDNPLTARVAVNRQWEAFFGRGLVSTPEDFGTQGAPPSHPELLDWLARQLIRQGWSMKKMHRLMVTSVTYRQSAEAAPSSWDKDPTNRLLSRFPRRRLDAEAVRDTLLVASGLLTMKVGGPSVFPPQPSSITSLSYGSPQWPTSEGPDRYRRGLYTYAKRTAPYAALTIFDAPVGDVCVCRRIPSMTPLQSLTLLNDPVAVESALALARRVLKEIPHGTSHERVIRMARLCLTRAIDSDEAERLAQFQRRQRERFRKDPRRAEAMIKAGAPKSIADDANPEELASWMALARVVLNLDETTTKE